MHSCSALSPEPPGKVAQPPTAKRLAFGLFNRFCKAIEAKCLVQLNAEAVGRIVPEKLHYTWSTQVGIASGGMCSIPLLGLEQFLN